MTEYSEINLPKTLAVNGVSFFVLKLLGKGKGGYSYLVMDDNGDKYVLKQIHHEPCSYYSFGNKIEAEMNDYHRLSEVGISLPRLLDVDIKEERLLKEYIEGDTIFDWVKNGIDLSDALVQVLEMAKKCHAANLNIDYYPTNFIMSGGVLYYIDYECNNYMDEWNFENWGIKYWSKTPEFLEVLNKK